MENTKKDNIINILKTRKDANELLSFLDLLSDNTHSVNDFSIEKLVRDTFKENYIPKWADYLISSVNPFLSNKDGVLNIRNLIIELKKDVEKAKDVKIEIPFTPSDDFIEEVYGLLNDDSFFLSIDTGLKDNFLIDLVVNKTIKGGVKIFVEGRFIDVTYRSVVKNYLMSKDVIKRYL